MFIALPLCCMSANRRYRAWVENLGNYKKAAKRGGNVRRDVQDRGNGDVSKADELLAKIKSQEALIGVIGLGYVGLPLCLAIAEAGVKVIGFDVDPEKVEALSQGKAYLRQFPSERISEVINSGVFAATHDMARLDEPDVIIICVPTPLTKHHEPDLSYVTGTAETVARRLRPGQLIILESTTFPGTTVEVLKPILSESGLSAGEDFFLAYSPEREDPGNLEHTTVTTPKS